MKSYYRVMLGKGSMYAPECSEGKFIGTDFGIREDLSTKLPDDWRAFNKSYIPIFLQNNPGKSKVAAGLACGALWTVSKGMQQGDIALCPDGTGNYHVGEITGDYYYQPDGVLPHRRKVQWYKLSIDRNEMSEGLRNSTGSIGTVSNITKHHIEIEKLLAGIEVPVLVSSDETVEDPSAFAMESHLEDFLVNNWSQTELGKDFNIYQDEDGLLGKQYDTDTGPMDILAISKDGKTLLVIELKKGRASDVVVGQILRYMGYVKDVLAEEDQSVRGAIIALDNDPRIQRALVVVPDVEFYRYEISFKLVKS